jgi:S-adenosylmethionine:tRNA ribosyltransferase-isomerase
MTSQDYSIVKTSDFDYDLPPELIAQTPSERRDESQLLVVDRQSGEITHRRFRDLPSYLRAGDLLAGNDSRVIPARLHGVKATGGQVELFLLRPAGGQTGGSEAGRALAEARTNSGPATSLDVWECLVGGKGLRPGVQVQVTADGRGQSQEQISATILAETQTGGRLVGFHPPVVDWLWDVGEVPLPPYIHAALADPERYQTIYSRIEGSVASSTAGLHFTPELLLKLRELGVHFDTVTLHIGIDTFRPVQEEEIEKHQIHREWLQLTAETARAVNETRLAGGRVIAIGTTVVRVLESAAKIALGYRPGDEVPPDSVCGWQTVVAFSGETDLYIRPGHRFRAVDAMITNFHLPRSTLIMLVSAFAGKELIDRAYAEAIRERYRFYSFGDAMLIL